MNSPSSQQVWSILRDRYKVQIMWPKPTDGVIFPKNVEFDVWVDQSGEEGPHVFTLTQAQNLVESWNQIGPYRSQARLVSFYNE
jgi:hypothetical protein